VFGVVEEGYYEEEDREFDESTQECKRSRHRYYVEACENCWRDGRRSARTMAFVPGPQ